MVMLLAIVGTTLMLKWDMVPNEAYMPIILFLFVLLIFSVAISYLLHFVYLAGNELLVKRFSKTTTYPRAAIKSMHCAFIILRILKTNDGKRRIFVSRLSQVQQDVFNF